MCVYFMVTLKRLYFASLRLCVFTALKTKTLQCVFISKVTLKRLYFASLRLCDSASLLH